MMNSDFKRGTGFQPVLAARIEKTCLQLWAIALLLSFSGCDERSATIRPSGSPSTQKAVVAHPGAISGRVKFSGKAPTLLPLNTASVPACNHPAGIPDESVVINSNGTLANVFVYLKGVPASSGSGEPPVVLDQVNCQYVPHVAAVQVGQTLRLKSSDPFLHNVHIADAQPPINWAFTGIQQRDCTFDRPGFLKVRCDVHPWMTAWVGVFDSPYFAVTGADGTFTIGNLPAGRYTLTAWQERFGEVSQPITVAPDGTVSAEIEFK